MTGGKRAVVAICYLLLAHTNFARVIHSVAIVKLIWFESCGLEVACHLRQGGRAGAIYHAVDDRFGLHWVVFVDAASHLVYPELGCLLSAGSHQGLWSLFLHLPGLSCVHRTYLVDWVFQRHLIAKVTSFHGKLHFLWLFCLLTQQLSGMAALLELASFGLFHFQRFIRRLSIGNCNFVFAAAS